MMVFALIAPPALEAVYAPRPESVSRQGALVTLWQDDRRALKVVHRTAASPDRWSTPAPASTSSSYPDEGTGLAVVVEPGDGASVLADVGSDDRVPFMLGAVKQMTGWSWERVAEALGRSRQAVHAWTLGKEISQPNLERLARLHATLSFVDRGDAERNRVLLQIVAGDGRLAADLLNAGRFDEVRALLGPGDGDRERAGRLRLAASVQQNESRTHWFDRLAETRGEEQPLEIIPSGERQRVVARRRG
jgi:hypothetical protein